MSASLGSSCTALFLACMACSSDGAPAPGEPFAIVLEDLEGALMSVSGSSADDVWIVGADTRDGKGATVLHFDGKAWTRKPSGVEHDLWWVHVFDKDSAWMGGVGGTILRHDGKDFERMATPGSSTVFGVWGAAEDDVWAVGGEPDVAPGFVWHFDGSAWSDLSAMLPEGEDGPVLFKVWGRSSDDVWIVGTEGVALHWDGKAFTAADTGSDQRLFTVHGVPRGEPSFIAVGGVDAPRIVESNGTTWHSAAPDPLPKGWPAQLFGVYMDAEKHGYAVGYDGLVLERDETAWKLLDTRVEIFNPLHAVWVDPEGGMWSVGGDVLSPIPSEGVLLHRGKTIANIIEDGT